MGIAWDFTLGSVGATVTAANTGCDSIFNAGGTMVLATPPSAPPVGPNRSVLFTGSSANSALALVENLTTEFTPLTLWVYFPTGGLPTAEIDLARVFDSTGTAVAWRLALDSAGRLRFRDSAGTLPTAGLEPTAQALTVGQWHKIVVDATPGASTGTVRIRHYIGSSSTANWDSGTLTGQPMGAAWGGGSIRVGFKAANTTATGTMHLAQVTAPDVVSAPSATANAGPDQSGIPAYGTFTLDASGSTGATSYAWTQTAGPTAALSSTTAQKPTGTMPGTLAGTTLTYSLVVNGTSTADTVSISGYPAQARYVRGGVEVPAQMVYVSSP